MADAVIGALRVWMGLDSAEFEKGADASEKRLRSLGTKFESIGTKIAAVGVGMSAAFTTAFLAVSGRLLQGGQDAADAAGQVEAALTSMGNASGKTLPQLQEAAEALRDLTGIDDDDILRSVTSNLLTFGNVSGAVFDRAQKAILDVSTRLKTDLQSATQMVGKALNAPTQGLAALRRVGIQFTDQQEKQIEKMEKVGDVAGAQAIMLGELERQFGGAAEAAAKADIMKPLRTAVMDLEGAFEPLVRNQIAPLIEWIAKLVRKIAELPPETIKTVAIFAAVAAAIGPVVIALGTLVTSFGALLPVIAAVATAIRTTFLLALSGLLTPAGLVIAALTALAAGAVYLGQKYNSTAVATRELSGLHKEGSAALAAYEKAALAAATATEKERAQAEAAAKAKRQQVLETLRSAQAKMAEAQATLNLVRAEAEQRIHSGKLDPEGAGLQLGAMGRQEDLAMARLKAAGEESVRIMRELMAIEQRVQALAPPTAVAVNTVNTAIEGTAGAAKKAKAEARDFKAELKSLEERLSSPEQRAILQRAEDIKLLTEAFEKGKLEAAELARMLRLLDEAAERDNFASTVKEKPTDPGDLKSQVPDLRSVFGQLMSPEDEAALKAKFVSFGQDFVYAIRHGQLDDFFASLADRFMDKLVGEGMTMLFDMLKQWGGTANGSNGWGSGGVFGPIANILGSMFKAPGFAFGGSLKVGGAGGVDSQLVQFRATPGENIHITRPGQELMGGASLHFDLRGAVMTEDLLQQMQGMANDARTGAVADARQVIPADLMRQQSRRLGGTY